MLALNCTPIINSVIIGGEGAVSNIMVEWLLLGIKVDGTFDDSQQTVTNSTDGYVSFKCSCMTSSYSLSNIEVLYHQMAVC